MIVVVLPDSFIDFERNCIYKIYDPRDIQIIVFRQDNIVFRLQCYYVMYFRNKINVSFVNRQGALGAGFRNLYHERSTVLTACLLSL